LLEDEIYDEMDNTHEDEDPNVVIVEECRQIPSCCEAMYYLESYHFPR
jgi:hypothetical protein